MRECIAIRHLEFEDLGYWQETLQEAGFHVRHIDAPKATPGSIAKLDPDLLVVLGAPLGANDEADYPFLGEELALLRHRLERDLPTLGICLGAQLMARAAGAKVAEGHRAEIGWKPLRLTELAMQTPLAHLDGVPVFHWHSDVFDLPEHCLPLASTDDCPNQAMIAGRNLLGVQFHPEVTAQGLETWYVGHYRALRDPRAPGVQALREQAERHAPRLREAGERLLRDWLAGLQW